MPPFFPYNDAGKKQTQKNMSTKDKNYVSHMKKWKLLQLN